MRYQRREIADYKKLYIGFPTKIHVADCKYTQGFKYQNSSDLEMHFEIRILKSTHVATKLLFVANNIIYRPDTEYYNAQLSEQTKNN